MAPQFTDSVSEALQKAFERAKEYNQTEVTENNLLAVLLEDVGGYFTSLLTTISPKVDQLIEEVGKAVERQPTFTTPPSEVPPGRSLQAILQEATKVAERWKDSYVAGDQPLLLRAC